MALSSPLPIIPPIMAALNTIQQTVARRTRTSHNGLRIPPTNSLKMPIVPSFVFPMKELSIRPMCTNMISSDPTSGIWRILLIWMSSVLLGSAWAQMRSEALRLLKDGMSTHYGDEGAAPAEPASRIAPARRSAHPGPCRPGPAGLAERRLGRLGAAPPPQDAVNGARCRPPAGPTGDTRLAWVQTRPASLHFQ